jgi:putative Holliday junction resolvase
MIGLSATIFIQEQLNAIFAPLIIMGRILAIDYGRKRTGLAVSDPLKMIANKLGTVRTHELFPFFDGYFSKETIDTVVVGYPVTLKNEPAEILNDINPFLKQFEKKYPTIKLELADERFTSKMAFQTMIDAGLKKKQRRDKELIDAVSAVILLQTYLETLRK